MSAARLRSAPLRILLDLGGIAGKGLRVHAHLPRAQVGRGSGGVVEDGEQDQLRARFAGDVRRRMGACND